MERYMPGHRVLVSKAEGPFSDDDEFGTLSWFPAVELHQRAEKVILDLRRDFFTSVVKLLREIALKAPDFLIGVGQGGFVSLGVSRPGVVEAVLQARAVQAAEALKIGEFWSKVKLIVVGMPRMSRVQNKKLGPHLIQQFCPEMIDMTFPVTNVRTIGVKEQGSETYDSDKDVFAIMKTEIKNNYGEIMWEECLAKKPREMWSHEGHCVCGKKTYLFGQCSGCMREDAEIRDQAIEQAVLDAEAAELEGEDAFPSVNASRVKLIPQVGLPGYSKDYRCQEVIFIARSWMHKLREQVQDELDSINGVQQKKGHGKSLYKVNRIVEHGECTVTWALWNKNCSIPLCLGHSTASLREHPFRLVMLVERYSVRGEEEPQCSYRCVQYCVDENFERRGSDGFRIGQRSVQVRLYSGMKEFQEALTAVWAAQRAST
jgi:hypothetical protein